MSVTQNPYSSPPVPEAPPKFDRLRDLSGAQWKSGAAAWLGWMFDGMDMHLYTLVATPFVAELLAVDKKDPAVGYHASWIQAGFLAGWALGGSIFGRIGDRIGRSKALILTILTYAAFTGLSYFAHAWWHLLIFRFLAALGIGGEWAVGAALLSETWPKSWRPWLAAVLQSGVNIGVMLASVVVYVMAGLEPRSVFLVGIIPALLTLWIRKAVPEPEEWHAAKNRSTAGDPGIIDLFRGPVLRLTLLTLFVCGFSLTAHWAFMFWCSQHLRNLPDIAAWTDAQKSQFVSGAMTLVMIVSIVGNFLSAAIARWIGYRFAILIMCLGYFASMFVAFGSERGHESTMYWLALVGIFQGVFALFTMYLPPLFPTLLRTTGAGFCYNFGRMAAAIGTVGFGLAAPVGDFRIALFYASFLFLPAAAVAWLMPEAPARETELEPVE